MRLILTPCAASCALDIIIIIIIIIIHVIRGKLLFYPDIIHINNNKTGTRQCTQTVPYSVHLLTFTLPTPVHFDVLFGVTGISG